MRNLKRALSLALAAIMLIGMMALGTSAASVGDFSDGAQIEHTEAANVITGLGIMTGRDDGSFDPDATITRAEMTVVIGRLLQGPSANPENYKGLEIFSDVNGHWAAGWINMAYAGNIVSGVGDDRFAPDTTLNVGEATTMILKALGVSYDEANWPLGVMSKAIEIKLFGDMSATASAPMTRDMVAALTFNGLIYSPSGATTTFVVTAGEEVVYRGTNALEAYVIASATTGTLTTDTVAADSLGAVKFGLSEGTTEDDFGRVTKAWKVDGEVLVDIPGTTAVLTYTSEVGETNVAADLKGYSVPVGDAEENTTVAIGTAGTLNSARATIKVVNGAAAAALGTSSQTPANAIANLTGNGKVVEVYATDKLITKVVVVTYSVDTLKSITEKNGVTTYRFNTAPLKTNDEDDTNVILNGAVNEGDVVTIAATSGGKYYVYPTTAFTASQTAKRTSGSTTTITLSGAPYVIGNGVSGAEVAGSYTNSSDSKTYYMDINGFIVKVEGEQAAAPQYALITGVAATATAITLDNPIGYTVEVRAVLADGTVTDFTLATALTTESNQYGTTSAAGSLVAGSGNTRVLLCAEDNLESALQTSVNTALNGKVFSYTPNNKGQMVISAMTAASGSMVEDRVYLLGMANAYKGATSHGNTGATATGLFTSQTVFVFYSVDGTKVAAEAYTGTVGLPIDTSSGVNGGQAVITASASALGVAEVVFLQTSAVAPTVDYVFVDVSDKTSILKPSGSGSTWQYTGLTLDGAEITVTCDTELTYSGLYVFDADYVLDSTAVVDTDDAAATGDAHAGDFSRVENATAQNGLLKVGDTWVDISEAEILYTENDLDEIAGVNCFVVMDTNTTASAVFVYAKYVVTYTVTYSANGVTTRDGKGVPAQESGLASGDKANGGATPTAPEAVGKVFVGWSTDNSDSDPLSSAWDFANDTVDSNTTIYAIWKDAENAGSLTATGGTGSSGLTITATAGSGTTLYCYLSKSSLSVSSVNTGYTKADVDNELQLTGATFTSGSDITSFGGSSLDSSTTYNIVVIEVDDETGFVTKVGTGTATTG